MSNVRYRSNGRFGLAVVMGVAAGGSLVMAACAARAPQTHAVAAASERAGRGVASTIVRTAASTSTSRSDLAATRGGELFAKYCAICHGDEGDGAGKFAYLMNPRPRDFRKGNFKISTTENQIPTNQDLVRTISRGMPGSAMPPWAHLPAADLEALVRHVRQTHIDKAKSELEAMVSEGTRRMLVNAAYWCMGMEGQIPADGTKVDLVGEYKYRTFGFDRDMYTHDLKPSDHAM